MAFDTALILGSTVGAFVFAFMGSFVAANNKKFMPLQGLFVFFSILLLLTSAGMMRELGTINSTTATMIDLLDTYVVIMVFALYLGIAYYIVVFIWEIIEWLRSGATGKMTTSEGGKSG